MGGGGDKQKPSKAEIQQAQQASDRWNERVDDGFLDLEKRAIAESRFDHSEFISSRSSSDLAKQEKLGLRGAVGAGASGSDIASFGNALSAAETTRKVDSQKQALDLKDSNRLNVAKLGQDVTANSESGLGAAASNSNSRASNDLRAKIFEDNSKFSAILDAGSKAVTGLALRNEGFRLNKGGIKQTHEDGLRNPKKLSKTGQDLGFGPIIRSI